MTIRKVLAQARMLWVIWGAMLASTGVYLVVLQVAAPATAQPDALTALALNVVAVGMAASSLAVPLFLWKAGRRSLRPIVEEVPDEDADPGLFRDAVPKRRVFRQGPALLEAALARAQAPFILSLALSEAVCLFGFVLAFLGHPPGFWVPLYLLGVLLLLVRAPRLSRFVAHLEAHFDARFVDLGG